VATVFVGEPVLPGSYDQRISHYTLLRTIEAMYGLPPLGESRQEQPITSVWRAAPPE
jgi:phosphatidylinositol-3-phosphatase